MLPHPTHSGIASLERGPDESGTVRMSRGWEEGEENKVVIDLDCIGNALGIRIAIPQTFLKKVLNARDVARFDKKEWRREWSEDMRVPDGTARRRQALEVFQVSGSATDRSGRFRNVIKMTIRGWTDDGGESAESSAWMTAPHFDSLVRSALRDFGRGNDMTDLEIRRMRGEFEDSVDGVMERFDMFLDSLDHDPERPFPCAWLIREQAERAVEALVKLGVDRDSAQGGYVDWSLADRKFRDAEYHQHPANRERIERELEQERGAPWPRDGIPARPLRMRDGSPPPEKPS